jgi:hypothetical protein
MGSNMFGKEQKQSKQFFLPTLLTKSQFRRPVQTQWTGEISCPCRQSQKKACLV